MLTEFIRDINGKINRKKWLWALVNFIFITVIIGTCFSYKYNWYARDNATIRPPANSSSAPSPPYSSPEAL